MKRHDLEHILRAAGAIAECDTMIVIGSQAILASHPDAPAELTVSAEADVYPKDHPERADMIEGSIGEMSPFHKTFRYYAEGVGPETAILPTGWEQRLVVLQNANTRGVRGLCLSPVDIAISKLAAGRPKDIDYVAAMLRHRLVEADTLVSHLAGLPAGYPDLIRSRLQIARNRP